MKRTRSAGGVIMNPRGEIVVVSQHGTSWSLPKGHVEDGEGDIAAALREIHEETGLSDVVLVKPLGQYQRHRIDNDGKQDPSEFKTIIMFLFKTSSSKLSPVDKENPEAKYVSRDDVVKLLTHPSDKAFFEKILPMLDHP